MTPARLRGGRRIAFTDPRMWLSVACVWASVAFADWSLALPAICAYVVAVLLLIRFVNSNRYRAQMPDEAAGPMRAQEWERCVCRAVPLAYGTGAAALAVACLLVFEPQRDPPVSASLLAAMTAMVVGIAGLCHATLAIVLLDIADSVFPPRQNGRDADPDQPTRWPYRTRAVIAAVVAYLLLGVPSIALIDGNTGLLSALVYLPSLAFVLAVHCLVRPRLRDR